MTLDETGRSSLVDGPHPSIPGAARFRRPQHRSRDGALLPGPAMAGAAGAGAARFFFGRRRAGRARLPGAPAAPEAGARRAEARDARPYLGGARLAAAA